MFTQNPPVHDEACFNKSSCLQHVYNKIGTTKPADNNKTCYLLMPVSALMSSPLLYCQSSPLPFLCMFVRFPVFGCFALDKGKCCVVRSGGRFTWVKVVFRCVSSAHHQSGMGAEHHPAALLQRDSNENQMKHHCTAMKHQRRSMRTQRKPKNMNAHQ